VAESERKEAPRASGEKSEGDALRTLAERAVPERRSASSGSYRDATLHDGGNDPWQAVSEQRASKQLGDSPAFEEINMTMKDPEQDSLHPWSRVHAREYLSEKDQYTVRGRACVPRLSARIYEAGGRVSNRDSLSKDEEVILLRRRIKRQRAELRRLNRQLSWFGAGMEANRRLQREFEYRKKMIDAFGLKAVCAAEGHPI
jgi:hypothetical protein